MTSPLRPTLAGWPHEASPFHDGERRAQRRAGIDPEQLDGPGRRLIRDYMPEEHRELFEKLPYLIVGAADDDGQLWASMLSGPAGFVRAPDARTLRVEAHPLGADPMAALVTPGRRLGVLGLELATRRRNRANGELVAVDPRGLTLHVAQSFGNCPKYIQARHPLASPRPAANLPAEAQGPTLSAAAIEVIAQADTFFIASATPRPTNAGSAAPSEGVDVSHRGGKPGFVAIKQRPGGTVLTAPDFRGNHLFNTLGNLELEPRAGLLFVDFTSGALLSLTGQATVLWDDPRIAQFAGAQRLLEVRVTRAVLMPEALPWRWSSVEPAPQLAATGAWRSG